MPTSDQIRKQFLDHFAQRGHAIVPSAPMVVKDDPTLMFTNAGMNQFKDLFLGNRVAKDKRVADTQKCLRVSGKHNDLEEVGIDTYHHTMFEMLGNWSFGDYFKKEAVEWAWELLVDTYKIDTQNLYVTYFGGDEKDGLAPDDETKELWLKRLPAERVLPFGKKDNFWEMGDTGPCGPCTEIHVDVRTPEEKDRTAGKTLVNNDHPQVIEIWNNVFMQFERKSDGKLLTLPAQHVDTGMGFERLCMVLQGKRSNYDTDVFQPLIQALAKLADKTYSGLVTPGSTRSRDNEQEKVDIALRVIADHVRAISFAIADGQLPSNTGAGYVIRRILRRAVRYGYSFLGFTEAFMYELVPVLVGQMGDQFPELKKQQQLISNVILEEEKAFLRTLEQGIKRFEAHARDVGQKFTRSAESDSEWKEFGPISGSFAFELFDTFGFPIDLTQLLTKEKGLWVDMDEFQRLLQKQKTRSRAATAVATGDWTELAKGETEFVGYDSLNAPVKILRYRKVSEKSGDHYQLVLDRTPFYPEGGGQVGDTGWLIAGNEKVEVIDTKRENQLIVHFTNQLPKDTAAAFTAQVDEHRRALTMRNHTATHLLHHVLREKLGTHVEQKGSLVAPDKLRFDISHFAKISSEELLAIEQEVNALIREDIAFDDMRNVPIEKAKEMGAMALFGEKYGDQVRVVKFGPSVELCGGTHVPRTGVIGPFRIVSEGALAAGIRRIEALTSEGAERMINDRLEQLDAISGMLKNPADPVQAVQKLIDQNAALTKDLEKANKDRVQQLATDLPKSAKTTGKGKVLVMRLDLDGQSLKDLGYRLRELDADLAWVAGSILDSKPLLAVSLGKNFATISGLKATDIIKQISPSIKGGGGGQPDFATAGGKEPGGMGDALKLAEELLQ